MIEVGAVLAGKYRVLAELGAGGMGRVFRAENMLTGKQVALKCLHAHITAGSDASERLLREARAASSLTHSNVVDVYDVVRDGETLFLVMEMLRGETLRSYLERNPQPKISEFIALMLPAMAGVEAAHQSGVIHRDLKPENIFLAQVGGMPHAVIKVLDFGIAKLAAARGPTLTRTGAALGTPLYMSLEQLRGDKDVDQRADVYAFGVMLYEAVTGSMPYEAETLPELAIKVATTDPPAVKSRRPDVPTPLARIIDWAVARDRNQRLPDLRTLQQELEVFARDRSFREQMTNREAPMPRLAAESPHGSAATAPAHSVSPRAAAARQPPATSKPDADTLRARELVSRTSIATTSNQRRSRWAIGAAVSAGVLVAAFWWLQGQLGQEAGPSDAAAVTETLKSDSPVPSELNAAAAPEGALPTTKLASRPSPLPAPGASSVEVQPVALPSEHAATPAEPAPTPSHVAEQSAAKSAPPGQADPARRARPKVRVVPPVVIEPVTNSASVTSNAKAPLAAPPAPAKKSSLELVGF